VVIGGLLTFFTRWAERRAEAKAARRTRAADILGRVRTFLTDVDPARIGINVNPETTPTQMDALKVRLDVLRDEISVFSAAADDDRVMDRTAELEVALFNTFHWVGWHARDLLRHSDNVIHSLHFAQAWHDKALTLVRIVLDLVRGRDVTKLEADVTKLEAELRRLEEATPGEPSPSTTT
jgi:hypothetical protein